MKNNRKNRKLNFIKIKNDLRLGITKFYSTTKISKELKLTQWYIDTFISNAKKDLFKLYKLVLNKIDVKCDYCDDDFHKDLTTVRISLSLK